MQLQQYTLQNKSGAKVQFINFGAIVTGIRVPDRNGRFENVVLTFDDINQFVKSNPSYYGAVVGRFANRISNASFVIEGEEFRLFQNDGKNALHGGKVGFDKVFWNVEPVEENRSYRLSYFSQDMEEGYPGNLKVEVVYSLSDDNEFKIEYSAQTDKATHVNLTHHAYFNLSGQPQTTMLNHELMIDSDYHTVSDASYIPTGEIREVSDALDFRKPKLVGEQIETVHEGYNHNYILRNPDGHSVVATVFEPGSGRAMEVRTTEPGLQFYSGYFLPYRFEGLCLEAQHFPDSPNRPEFPSTLLQPGQLYRQTTSYKFSLR